MCDEMPAVPWPGAAHPRAMPAREPRHPLRAGACLAALDCAARARTFLPRATCPNAASSSPAPCPTPTGRIHIGHLVEYMQTDIWVRFQRCAASDVVYFCADDTHGTAIMIRARQEGRTRGAGHRRHERGSTSATSRRSRSGSTTTAAPTGREPRAVRARSGRRCGRRAWSSSATSSSSTIAKERRVPRRPLRQGHLPEVRRDGSVRRHLRQVRHDLHADRSDRPGEHALRRRRRRCAARPHLFFDLERLHAFSTEWTQAAAACRPEIANYLQGHFLAKPLRDWDISRPAPYFGFEIPDAPGKYWYVWFDAPIGYIASTRVVRSGTARSFDDWWRSRRDDARSSTSSARTSSTSTRCSGRRCCKASGFTLPRRVQVHGLLTVNGEKMSKSQGHVHPRAHLRRAPRPGVPALLLREQAHRPRSTTSI